MTHGAMAFPLCWPPIPQEEGATAFYHRLAAALAGIHARHQAQNAIAIVTHGGSLGMMMVRFLGMEVRRPTPFWFDNASLRIVDIGTRGVVLSRLNDTSHLRPRAAQR
jgi:broad specificity phosphatase PhoE